MTDFKIVILGSMAKLFSQRGKHFSILLEKGDKHILIDPAVRAKSIPHKVSLIIVTQSDPDHYFYIKEYGKIPVYSIGAIIDKLPKGGDYHPFLKPLDIDGLKIHPVKTIHKVGVPSIGLRLDVGDRRISILPEFLKLGKAEADLVKNTSWIVGVGDWEKDDEKKGKISFLNMLKLAEELRPKSVYLTNLREDIFRHKLEIEKELEKWNGRILKDGDTLEINNFKKAEKWFQAKPAYRIFTLDDLINTPHFQKGKAVVGAKYDGLRIAIFKRKGKVTILTDPEETETPDKTKRLPWQVKEIEAMKEDNFALDAELVMIDKKMNEVLHRTSANALVNGKFDPMEVSKMANLEVFDIVEFEGKNITSWPLKERLEALANFKDSAHIHFVRPKTDLKEDALSYIIDLDDRRSTEAAVEKIMGYAHNDGAFPKFISEGIMLKLLSAPYEHPQNHSWVKWKERYEIDGLVIKQDRIIREGKPTKNFNYHLAVGPISEEWAKDILEKDRKAVVSFRGKWYNVIGKTDNTKIDIDIGKILRVAAEDVNKFETANRKHPYYKAYVSIVLQPVPEKDVPDTMFVLERLSELTPRREEFAIKKSVKDDIKISIKNGKIPKEIYDKYAESNEPLPQEFYVDYREGSAWAQTHIRGLDPADIRKFKQGKMTLAQLFTKHSIHIDLRMNLKKPKLIQWVITDNDINSYLRFMKGELRETAGGVENVQQSLAIVKPSAVQVEKDGKMKEPAIKSGREAKELADIQIKSGSYIIPAGEVGATAYKDAWMGLVWKGKVKAGIQRKDYHEYFLFPDDKIPEKNKEFFNGRFIVRALPEPRKRWQIWKASGNPLPQDPIEHKDGGYYFPIYARNIDKFGKEHYQYGKKEPVK